MKDILFIGYKKCGTSNKAETFLKNREIAYTFRDIKENKPTEEEIREFHRKSEVDIKRFFNTSGKLYKEGKIKDRLPSMTQEEKYALLAEDGLLVKRPILVREDKVLVGFKEEEWLDLFEGGNK